MRPCTADRSYEDYKCGHRNLRVDEKPISPAPQEIMKHAVPPFLLGLTLTSVACFCKATRWWNYAALDLDDPLRMMHKPPLAGASCNHKERSAHDIRIHCRFELRR